jgi:hypothetical protein
MAEEIEHGASISTDAESTQLPLAFNGGSRGLQAPEKEAEGAGGFNPLNAGLQSKWL